MGETTHADGPAKWVALPMPALAAKAQADLTPALTLPLHRRDPQ
jgi:hypothetical protein